MGDPSKLTREEYDAVYRTRHRFIGCKDPDRAADLYAIDAMLERRRPEPPAPDIPELIQAFLREMTAENQRALWIALDAHQQKYGHSWIYRANLTSIHVSFIALPSSDSDCYPIKIT